MSNAPVVRSADEASPGPVMLRSDDGVDLALHDLGGDGPPLLVLHAAGFHGLAYAPLAAHLQHDFHVWGLDLRGHGDSGLPAAGLTGWYDFTRDVVAALDYLGGNVSALGHSMGGAALLMAVAARPGALRGVLLYEPAIVHRDQPLTDDLLQTQRMMVAASRRRRATYSSHAAALEALSRKAPTSLLNACALAAYVEHGFVEVAEGVRLKCDPAVEAAVFGLSAEQDPQPGYDALSCPAFVAYGSLTDTLQLKSANDVAEHMGVTPIEVHWHGHFGPLESPARFAGLVQATLLASLNGGAASGPFTQSTHNHVHGSAASS